MQAKTPTFVVQQLIKSRKLLGKITGREETKTTVTEKGVLKSNSRNFGCTF